MTKSLKILGVIPARGGSKGIPHKNIVKVGGKPLVAWTIQASLKSKFIDKTVVSSDDPKILEIAKKFGAQIIKRPKALATDKAPATPVVKHVLTYLKNKQNYLPDIIAYLQPTSPLRNCKDIDEAIKLLLKENATAVISVYEIDNKYLKSFILDNKGYLKGQGGIQHQFSNRQDTPRLYIPNGAIYLIKRKTFLQSKQLFSNKTLPYLMSPKKSLDLDTPADLKLLRRIFKKYNL